MSKMVSIDRCTRAKAAVEYGELCYREWFGSGAMSSEQAFAAKCAEIINKCRQYQRQVEQQKINELVRLVDWIEPYCGQEPYKSTYDHCNCIITLCHIETALRLHQFQQAYELLEGIMEILDQGEDRRLVAGLPARPNSSIKLKVITLLADIKWQDDEDNQDRLYSPLVILQKFNGIESRILTYLSRAAASEDRIQQNLLNLTWAKLAILKMFTRYDLDEALHMIPRFAEHGSAQLAFPGGYRIIRTVDQVADLCGEPVTPPYWWFAFWDYEITKMWLLQRDHFYLDELTMLHDERKKTARLSKLSKSYLTSIELEYLWMKPHCRRRLEVISDEA